MFIHLTPAAILAIGVIVVLVVRENPWPRIIEALSALVASIDKRRRKRD